jgi:hypothetical protein
MTKKKIILISLIVIAVGVIGFIGYHYIRYLKASSRMDELSADLERRISEWEKKDYKRPPLFGEPVLGNAAEYYQQVKQQIKYPEKDETYYELNSYFDGITDCPLSLEALTYLDSISPFAKTIIKGANAETYKPLLSPRNGWPDIATSRSIQRTVCLISFYGKKLEHDNQISEAVKFYSSVMRFGYDLMREGGTTYLLGIACVAKGRNELQDLVLADKLSAEELKKLLECLKQLQNASPSLLDIYYTEQLHAEVYIKKSLEAVGFLPMKIIFSAGMEKTMNKTSVLDMWDGLNIYSDERQNTHSLPYPQASIKLKNLYAKDTFLSDLVFHGIDTHYKYYRWCQASYNGLYILTALKLYHAQHGKYPDKLDALSPEIIPEMPLDPFTDKPFIYRMDDKGTLWLYGLGENMTDDGGDSYQEKDIVISPLK